VFVQGYLAGKFTDLTAMAGIAKILQGYATFADPRIINLALLGMGIGYLTKSQGSVETGVRTRAAGDWTGQIFTPSYHYESARSSLDMFVRYKLGPRYGLSFGYAVGEEPVPDFGPLSRGCPAGFWFDPLNQVCRPRT
jgi:hypothetical protein